MGSISIEHRNLSKQLIEGLVWISKKYRVAQPKVLAADGMLSAYGILLDGIIFILAKEKVEGKREPVILLSRKPRKPIVWVLFHEFYHYRDYLRTGIMPNFIALNTLIEKEADRIATLGFRAYNTRQ